MRKVQLFSIDEQQRVFAWMNDRPSNPPQAKQPVTTIDPFKDTNATVKLNVEELILFELSRYFRMTHEIPAQIHLNPCSIFEMSMDRWHAFPFMVEDRITVIPVVADPKAVPGQVHCIGCEETVMAARAVKR